MRLSLLALSVRHCRCRCCCHGHLLRRLLNRRRLLLRRLRLLLLLLLLLQRERARLVVHSCRAGGSRVHWQRQRQRERVIGLTNTTASQLQ